jgi:hypothetical protein
MEWDLWVWDPGQAVEWATVVVMRHLAGPIGVLAVCLAAAVVLDRVVAEWAATVQAVEAVGAVGVKGIMPRARLAGRAGTLLQSLRPVSKRSMCSRTKRSG